MPRTGRNTTDYADTELSQGTTYFYRVSAYNGAGESKLSNMDSATPGVLQIFGATQHLGGGSSVAIGDLNVDGEPDLAVVNTNDDLPGPFGAVSVLLNQLLD